MTRAGFFVKFLTLYFRFVCFVVFNSHVLFKCFNNRFDSERLFLFWFHIFSFFLILYSHFSLLRTLRGGYWPLLMKLKTSATNFSHLRRSGKRHDVHLCSSLLFSFICKPPPCIIYYTQKKMLMGGEYGIALALPLYYNLTTTRPHRSKLEYLRVVTIRILPISRYSKGLTSIQK